MNYVNKQNRHYRRTELRAHRLRGVVFLLAIAAILFMVGAFGVRFF